MYIMECTPDPRPARIERGQAVWRQVGGNGILQLGLEMLQD